MMQMNELTFGYSKKHVLFDGLNLNLKKGHIYGLFGVNGAGKTTLLKHMSGVLFPQKGSIEFKGSGFKNRPVELLQDLYIIPETFSLPPISIQSYFKIHAPFYPKTDEQKFYACLKEFDLTDSLKLHQLSYGQQKKFIIAFALSTNVSLILMDEPTNGLDIPSKSQFRKLLAQNIQEESCIVISTHQVRDLSSLIDYIIILDNGKIKFAHSMDEIISHLHFTVLESATNDVLFYEEQFGGIKAISRVQSDKEFDVDFELLFNAVINNSEIINNEFKN
jgi:ABC-2 type transport system ATP-binding protein